MKVYFEISFKENSHKKYIILDLFDQCLPQTCSRFARLCDSSSNTQSYKGTKIDRVVRQFCIQGGSIEGYTEEYEHEKEEIENENQKTSKDGEETSKHNEPFLLYLANTSDNQLKSACKFFITLVPTPHLEASHIAIGKIIAGKGVARDIERVAVDEDGKPKQDIVITDCGVIDEEESKLNHYLHLCNPYNDPYEEYPDDEPEIQKNQEPEPALKACQDIKGLGTKLFKEKNQKGALEKYLKSMRYIQELIPDDEKYPSQYKEFLKLKVSVALNIALVGLQCDEPRTALKYAQSVIESANDKSQTIVTPTDLAKAYYRRGLSHIKLKNQEGAIHDFEHALELIPGDPAITKELSRLKRAVAAKTETQKAAYSKFFS